MRLSLSRIGCIVALTVGAAACGGSTAKPTDSALVGTPITLAQAEVLASILTKNYDAGGAVISVAMPGGPNTTVTLQAEVDYTKVLGHGTLQTRTQNAALGPVVPLVWTDKEVLEGLPGLQELMTAKGQPLVTYVSRPITTTSAQDILLALLLKTASTQRENPGLIQQGTAQGDSTFLRTDTIRSTPVDVFHFGKKTTYWVAQGDGVLQRLEANLAMAPGSTVIDFLEHKAVTIPGPKVQEVVLASEVPDVVKALTGKNPASDPRTNVVAPTTAATTVTTIAK